MKKELYDHKQTFLPQKRNLYKSLYEGDLHRFGKKDCFIDPESIRSLITVPTEENLKKINMAELYVKLEFKAVMSIKVKFFKWFEELIKSYVKNNQKFLRKEKKKQQIQKSQNEED